MTIYPPHLRHVAALPWETKNSCFLQMWKKRQTECIFHRLFVIHPQILIFSVFKIANLSPWLQMKFAMSLFFYLFILAISSGIGNSCLSIINMILSDEDKILVESLYLKGYTAKRLTDEFPEKNWTKRVELISRSKNCDRPRNDL